MCFHVESLANEGWKVAVIGYPGSALPPSLHRSSIKQHHLRTPPPWIARLPRAAFIAVAPFKLGLQAVSLFTELTTQVHPPPELVLVQTPPALPTLLVVKAAAALVKARVVIDWHNLAYTILALRLGEKSKLVRLAEWLERWSGRKAYAHLFVTQAMKNYLDVEWNLDGDKVVLHDRPPAHFRRATIAETHALMCKLIPDLKPSLGDDWLPKYKVPETTPFTRCVSKDERDTDAMPPSRQEAVGGMGIQWREDRPALVVSSTSWTADEDFGLLLRAARLYEYRARALADPSSPNLASQTHSRSSTGENLSASLSPVSPSSSSSASASSHFSIPSDDASSSPVRTSKERRRPSLGALRTATLPNEPATSLPKLLIIVTGKGELKSRYLAEIAHLETTEAWRFVRIRTAWLEAEDYPRLLGSADVGVSLHTSSSGLDLPMKVVDMLGCGLPVCALGFDCLRELVRDRENGVVFGDAEGLARQWESLFANHPQRNWLMEGVGMREPFEAAASTLSKAGRNGLLAEPPATKPVAPPMSPNPSLTLLHSPGLTPSTSGLPYGAGSSSKSRRSTWAGNWKHVMRPLLDPPTPADDDEERRIDRYLSHASALKLSSPAGTSLLQRRAKQGYTPAPSEGGGSPSKRRPHPARQEYALAGAGDRRNANAFGFVSQAAIVTDGESQKGLRQRKSVSANSTAAPAGGQDDDLLGDTIPAIQVSKAPTPP